MLIYFFICLPQMLKIGIPLDAVKQALKRDTIDVTIVDMDPEKPYANQIKSNTCSEADGPLKFGINLGPEKSSDIQKKKHSFEEFGDEVAEERRFGSNSNSHLSIFSKSVMSMIGIGQMLTLSYLRSPVVKLSNR
jgi:hypothetical protein